MEEAKGFWAMRGGSLYQAVKFCRDAPSAGCVNNWRAKFRCGLCVELDPADAKIRLDKPSR